MRSSCREKLQCIGECEDSTDADFNQSVSTLRRVATVAKSRNEGLDVQGICLVYAHKDGKQYELGGTGGHVVNDERK